MNENENKIPALMTPAEVAHAFRVDPKTVVRWFAAGKLEGIHTPGGHARFLRDSVMALLNGGINPEDELDTES